MGKPQHRLRALRSMAIAVGALLLVPASLGPAVSQVSKQAPVLKPVPQLLKPQHKGPIVAEQVNWSAWEDGKTVSLSILLHNVSGARIDKLVVQSISATDGRYTGPTKLPVGLAGIKVNDYSVLNALFEMPADDKAHMVTIVGEAAIKNAVAPFVATIAVRPIPGQQSTIRPRNGVMYKQRVDRSKFPPVVAPDPRLGRNAETPMMIPLGPPRAMFGPTRRPTKALGASDAGNIRINDNDPNNVGVGAPPDPSAAVESTDGVVLATYNTGMLYSTDGGNSFTPVNLFAPQPGNPARTSFFPNSYGGLCCDQVVIYLPQHNLFVWLLQYWPVTDAAGNITQPNAQRIAWARPADLRADFWNAWIWGDLTPDAEAGISSGLGGASNEWLDYPDLAYSDTYLYVSTDRGWPNAVGSIYSNRRFVARLSLADMLNPASGTVGYGYAELTGNGVTKSHFVQNAPARMVVGSLDNTSTMRIFTWPDSSGSIGNVTQGISSITTTYNSTIPDGSDWVAVGFPGNISGATYRARGPIGNEYLFAFNAGINGAGRPHSYVRLESLGPSGGGYTASAEYDIWNPDFAFAMASLGTNGSTDRPEIGITVSVGGGTIGYPQGTVGYKDDFVVYIMTGSNGSQMVRYGDYYATRPIPGGAHMFGTTLYDINLPGGSPAGSTCSTVPCSAIARYVEFGRP